MRVVVLAPYRDQVPHDGGVTELDIDILRAVAAGQLPHLGLLTVELRRLEVLGLVDVTHGAARVTWQGRHVVQVANGECAAGWTRSS